VIFYDFLSLKIDVNVPSKKVIIKKIGMSLTTTAESDPLVRGADPRIRIRTKNVADTKHWSSVLASKTVSPQKGG
jgi:hypothetical protein